MAVEEDLFARLGLHRRRRVPGASAVRSTLDPSSMAADDRPGRAADADARLARDRSTTASAPDQRDAGSARCCGSRSAAERRSGSWSSWPTSSELAPERLAEPDAVLPGGDPAGPGRAGELDGGRVLLDAGAGADADAAPGRARGARSREVLVAELAGRRRDRARRRHAPHRRASARRSSAAARRADGRRRRSGPTRCGGSSAAGWWRSSDAPTAGAPGRPPVGAGSAARRRRSPTISSAVLAEVLGALPRGGRREVRAGSCSTA